jgi:hypothetical protein
MSSPRQHSSSRTKDHRIRNPSASGLIELDYAIPSSIVEKPSLQGFPSIPAATCGETRRQMTRSEILFENFLEIVLVEGKKRIPRNGAGHNEPSLLSSDVKESPWLITGTAVRKAFDATQQNVQNHFLDGSANNMRS